MSTAVTSATMLAKVFLIASLATLAEGARIAMKQDKLETLSGVDIAISAESQGTYICTCDGNQVMKMSNLAAISLGQFPCLQKCAELGAKEYCTSITKFPTTCLPVP